MRSVRSGFSTCAVLAFAACAASCRASGTSPIPEARASDRAHGGPGVAVVELFTSEGCSSCPPAEAVFDEVVERARSARKRVIPLEFHVDYWDGLGWPDRFS